MNDTTFSLKGLVAEAENLSTLLNLFADYPSLQINCAKSTFVNFGLPQEEELQCSEALRTPIGRLPI